MFSEKELDQFTAQGIEVSAIKSQIENFRKGFPFLKAVKAATLGDGIISLSENDINNSGELYDQLSEELEVLKFVPASGAASRMFKALFSFVDTYSGSEEDYKKYFSDKGTNSIFAFFKRLDDFAFYEDLKKYFEENGASLEQLHLQKEFVKILEALLNEDGLNYGGLPKGLLKFHNYEDKARTPFEEHLVEGANYCKDKKGRVNLHFTVSPEHESKFKEKLNEVVDAYEKEFRAIFDISFSQQKKSTDTIAVDMDNEPFKEEDGSILFRPGGHGALIENLNDSKADIIFIKNIDNVVPDRLKGTTYLYKKALGGVLLKFQQKTFEYLKLIEAGEVDSGKLAEITSFVEKELCILPPEGFANKSDEVKIDYLKSKLNRPIRVCGMVKNEGEPGGGPFWVENSDGTTSLQIVESAQLDMEDEAQKAIAMGATHFNPVDLVCGVKDYKGEQFNLLEFRDPSTGFISYKSKNGKELKAQELPGLWNGAMAFWNTIFLEVPIITFNPVKTVNDLLRDEHQ
ncbi:DUF4301 family protein [Flexithrix dorotheae]|uniref:DUF4301 family protein n=1 Tax=Flexithrix dorotheae TaxID=70993 RepID=UPI000368B7BD|nr:DUF4301 family protein [Flexithrix dorotheae]